ncbi:MAG: tetratricopeptide repeat protein [Magnetococcales bacterium]|nr:tetratricopeptide repeat protein [Magnetococcales bacterium]
MTRPEETESTNPDSGSPHAQLMQEMQRVDGLVQAGLLDEAIHICEKAWAVWPDHLDILIFLVEIHWKKGSADRAKELILQGLQRVPNHVMLHFLMGEIAKSTQDMETALVHFQEVIRLEPNHVGGHYQCGAILAARGRHVEAVAAFERVLQLQPDLAEGHQSMSHAYHLAGWKLLADVHLRLHDHYRKSGKPLYPVDDIKDTYFLDGRRALAAARSALSVKLLNHFSVRRICFHPDPGLAGQELENLIYCPMEKISAFFLETRLRLPTVIDFAPGDAQQVQKALMVARAIDLIPLMFEQAAQALFDQCKEQRVDFAADRPWRVFAATSRWTTVMQYASRNVVDALERLGCQVHFEIEKSDLEGPSRFHDLKKQYAYNPHIIININRRGNRHLNPDIFNIVWYQDPMKEIREGNAIDWRERDIIFSAYPDFDDLLRKTGARHVRRQDLCVDLNTFYVTQPRHERRKVVFLGSSHHHFLHGVPGEERVLRELGDLVEQGATITRDHTRDLATRTHLDFSHVNDYLYSYVVRNRCVEWLCELAPELEWDVEVYGRHWDEIPIVAPYFRGEVPHGAAVAAIYNQARYALAAHPYMVKSQRLAELSACGCIPVLFDDRIHAEGPHWENEILYFKTREALRTCLGQEPKGDPNAIAQSCSYDKFARRILRLVEEELSP